MGQAEPALVALREALKLARGTHRLGEIAASHNNIGDALRTAGRFEEARVAFAEALRLDRGRGNSLGRSFDLANLGLTDALLGLRARARQELNKAKALAQEIGAPLNRLKALAGLARLDLAANRLAKARDHAAVGLALSRRLGLRTWLWRFLLLSGHAARAEGKLDLALRHFKDGVAIVDALPPRALSAAGMPKIQGQPSDLYDELIELLARRGQAEASFVLAERARLRRLVDRVSRNVLRLPEAAARQELAALVSLAADVEALRGARLRAKTAKARQGIDRELEAIEGRREARRRKLAALNPRLVSLVEAHAAPLAVLRRALPAKTALVAFYPGPRGVITWVFDPQGLKVHVADLPRPKLVTLVQHFREALTTFQPVKRPARRLYELLLGSLAPALRGRSHLVVVSSGILQLVPVAALHDGKDYLIGGFTLTYAQSATALVDLAMAAAPMTRPRVAGPRTRPRGLASRRRRRGSLSSRAPTGGWASMGPGLATQPPLPFARREVSALGALFPKARLYRRDAATRAALRQELRRATTLHLAMHAAPSIDEPLRSAFVLADGRLSWGDILALGPIAPRLVIASSCNAGVQPLDGADLIGLQPRLLQIAGARQVLGSVWRASDLGAALVIKRVLRGLASGLDVASALRKAQEALRRRRPHPGFWAGFRVDGLAR